MGLFSKYLEAAMGQKSSSTPILGIYVTHLLDISDRYYARIVRSLSRTLYREPKTKRNAVCIHQRRDSIPSLQCRRTTTTANDYYLYKVLVRFRVP
jgi:hypothetical protein